MLSVVWSTLLGWGLLHGCLVHRCGPTTALMFHQAVRGLEVGIDLAALVAFWFGVARVAEKAGLMDVLARAFRPLLRPLFPTVPREHPVLGEMAMNVAANMLGLGNAATPFGLKAMASFQDMNPNPDTATPEMITFVVLNSATLNLVPATMIALRAMAGAPNPAEPVVAGIFVTALAAAGALIANHLFRSRLARP
jgi:spore maturation protein A